MSEEVFEEMHWHDNMHRQLRQTARKHGFTVKTLHKWNENEKGEFADFVIDIDQGNMLGLKLMPALSVKPFEIFPYGKPVGLDDLDEVLADWAVARERH